MNYNKSKYINIKCYYIGNFINKEYLDLVRIFIENWSTNRLIKLPKRIQLLRLINIIQSFNNYYNY